MRGKILIATVALLATGCGYQHGGEGEPLAMAHPGGVPRCPTVFKVGARLPNPFYGCVPADGSMGYDTGAMPTVCLDGRTLFVWQDQRWAFPGQKVKTLTWKNKDYALAVKECTGVMPTEPTP